MGNAQDVITEIKTLKIVVFGASGDVGRRVVAEGVRRGHQMTAVARRMPAAGTHDHAVCQQTLDVESEVDLQAAVESHDIVITALRPRDGQEKKLVHLTARVVNAALVTGTRFIVVGGAAPLKLLGDPVHTVLTAPGFLPASVVPIAQACQEQHDWILPRLGTLGAYVCPPAMLAPGDRTGRYQIGKDTLLVGANGVSQISMEDFAVALLDEAEQSSHLGTLFTVAN